MAKTIKVVEEAKRAAPSKACVGCGKSIHARTATCPHCQAKQPVKEVKAVKPKEAPAKLQQEVSLLRLVVKHGGIDALQNLINDLIFVFNRATRLEDVLDTLIDVEKQLKD